MILPLIDYVSMTWSGTSSANLERIVKLQLRDHVPLYLTLIFSHIIEIMELAAKTIALTHGRLSPSAQHRVVYRKMCRRFPVVLQEIRK